MLFKTLKNGTFDFVTRIGYVNNTFTLYCCSRKYQRSPTRVMLSEAGKPAELICLISATLMGVYNYSNLTVRASFHVSLHFTWLRSVKAKQHTRG